MVRSTCCHAPISAASTSFMPVTGGMLRDITWLTRARDGAGTIGDEARALAVQRARGNLAGLAVDLHGHRGGIAQHHAQRWPPGDALHAAGAGHVVEKSLAARVVDLDP